MTGEVTQVVDSADDAETVHAFIKIADVHAGFLFLALCSSLRHALQVDFDGLFVECEGAFLGDGS